MQSRRFDQRSGYGGDAGRRDGAESFYRGTSYDNRPTEYYDYSRRRSQSPRRDDRRSFGEKDTSWDNRGKGRTSGDWQDDRARNRQTRTPPNQRAGLLGAPPGEIGTSPIGGQSGVNTQVIAALQAQQTQAWLAALQANQVQLSGGGSGGRYNDRNNQPNRPQGPRQWNTNRKRFQNEPTGPMSKRKRDDIKQGTRPFNRDGPKKFVRNPNRDVKSNAYNPAEPTCDSEAGTSTKEVILAELCEQVEKLRKREKIERNISDQDVDKLVLFSFNGLVHKCDVCDVVCKAAEGLRAHLMTKKHSLAVIEERADGKDPCRDIMDIDLKPNNWLLKNEIAKVLLEKQAAALEKARQEQRRREFEENPANYVTYTLNTRKVAAKTDKEVVITHTSEIAMSVKDFGSDQHLFGCEFVSTVVGFSCQLCKVLMNEDESVIEHIQSTQHKENYKDHIEKNKDYEESTAGNNKTLDNILSKNANKMIVLHESFDTDNSVYLRKRDSKLIVPDADIPSWCNVASLVDRTPEPIEEPTGDKEEATLPNEDDEPEPVDGDASEKDEEVDAEEYGVVEEDDGDAVMVAEEEEEEEDIVAVEETESQELESQESELSGQLSPADSKATPEQKETPVVEPEEVIAKETPARMPQRRAARGGAQARRGKVRAGPKGKAYKGGRVVTPRVDVDNIATPTMDDYEVIDQAQDA